MVEAERRAFGNVESYADVKVSPYPYEGNEMDLTPYEIQLYAEASRLCMAYFEKKEDFKPFVLSLDTAGVVHQMKQQSWKRMKEELASLVKSGQSVGFSRSQIVVSGMSGVLVHDIETSGRPQVSVRALVKDYVCSVPRFHLDKPAVLDMDA